MDEPSGEVSPNEECPDVIAIAPKGDLLLDVTFETSRSTLKATRKALPKPRPGQRDPGPPPPVLEPNLRLAYRVELAVLKKHSPYFTNLVGDTRFREARAIAAALDALSLRGEKPADVEDPSCLPRVRVTDDDEATRAAGRERAFADMLRILHGLEPTARPQTMLYAATLAVMADRFACAAAVARGLKVKWPAAPQPRQSGDGLSRLPIAAEEIVRQKVLVSWLLAQPLKFATATREIITFGSHRWAAAVEGEGDDGEGEEEGGEAAEARQEAVWWYLPDGLEEELYHRRQLLLTTLSSIPTHFLARYTSRTSARQCKLGYDSSSACDSFQLGEMVKFLAGRSLLFLASFSPSSLDQVKDFAAVDVNSILAALKQCPNYQVDRNHTNCGLRTRLMPIIDYVQTMLSANVVPVSLAGWKKDRKATSWAETNSTRADSQKQKKKEFVVGNGANKKGRVFRFTRAVASDQRLRYEGAMAADALARELFTADGWDWTPEE